MTDLSYHSVTRHRADCVRLFGAADERAVRDPYLVCADHIHLGDVLDVGAGQAKELMRILKIPKEKYFTLDNDVNSDADFVSVSDIPEERVFSLIVMNQILEHLTVQQAITLLRDVFPRLAANGILIVSVPNTRHPVRHWGDATHLTAWPPEDLYGLLTEIGLTVNGVYRSCKRRLPRNPFRKFVIRTVAEMFRMDWHDTTTLSAVRPASE